MFNTWILLSALLLAAGASSFMIHNTHRSLCLEESAATAEVLLKKCNLDSESQQWVWMDQGMLMCIASSRCLSAMQRERLQTQDCQGPEVDPTGLMWDCDRSRLISRNTSMLLSIDGRRVVLTHDSKHSKWRSLDEGDICQDKLRSRRASKEPDEFAKEKTEGLEVMTEEQREYQRWFYRTEDPTTWKFVLLGLAFVCLLVGFMLLGMGAMANKNRKKIAKYKAAAAVAQRGAGEELQVISPLRDDSRSKPPPQGHKTSTSNGEVSELKAGDIVVTWKDGNTSCLYPDPTAEEDRLEDKQEDKQEKEQEEKQEEKQEEVSALELEADEAVKTKE